MKKIIVTGGTGYIGSHTIIELIESSQYEPIAIDNCVRSTPETIDRIKKITGKDISFYKIDLCDKEVLFDTLKRIEDIAGIIHFAAYKSVPESVEKPLLYYRNNLNALSNILEATKEFHIPYLIFSSSCSVYGNVSQLPVNEDTPIGEAFCPYAHTKQIGEAMIHAFSKESPTLSSIILRYFNPVGAHISGLNGELSPDKPNNLLPIITQNAMGIIKEMTVYGTDYDTRDGSCIRDYIHVSDIANAHVKALEYLVKQDRQGLCDTFNLGSGNGVTVLEMLHSFENITGEKLNYTFGDRRSGDIPAIYSDSSKANTLLDWHCRYSVNDIMESAWKWENELKNNSQTNVKIS